MTQKIQALEEKCTKQRKTIKAMKEKLRRKDKKLAGLKDIIEDLRQKNHINLEQSVLINDLAGPSDFLKRQINKAKGLPLPNKYSEEMRKFALMLHFFSPKAYDYIRETYNTCLPHTRTLCKWYQHVNCDPGFTKEAFDALRIKVESSEYPVICSLVFDEMAIRKSLIWDQRAQKFYGRVDYGNHNIDTDTAEEASQVLVLLLTCINGSWKIPIGYFFITSVTGEQKSGIVNTALQLCENVGIKVVSVTCDGPVANFCMFSHLGCDILKNQEKTSFERGNTLVHAFIDPCHAVKLIRNAFGELRVFVDQFGRKIEFKYVEQLLELQEKKNLHLANKLKKAHIFFQKQKMKVKLATQLFSSSVADALEYCWTDLKIKIFEDCAGTISFINLMNDVFDILNSHSIRPPGFKKAMCPSNIGLITALFESATVYLMHLKLSSGELLINSRRKTGFIAMVINMKSALSLYSCLVENAKVLKYLPLYKVSQDHIELFFSAVRARGGFNNNPDAIQFRAAYKKLLVRAEIRDGGIGNCTPLEQISILTCSSKNPITALNELTEKESYAEITEDDSDLYETYLERLLDENDEYTDRVLQYIAGFVTKKLLRSIKCEVCVSLLLGNEDTNSLIYKKSRGGLRYASCSVTEIIIQAEKLIKTNFEQKAKPEIYYLYIFKFLCEVCDLNKFFSIDVDPDHSSNHKLLLIKSVIKIFLDIRFRYYGQMKSEKLSHRQFLNKLILFRNE